MAVTWNGNQLVGRIAQAAMRGIVRGTENVRTHAVRSIQSGQKTGRVYRRRSVVHQASAPGESPASDTGRLVQSSGTRYNPEELEGIVFFATAYAAPLEWGTVKMAPRPFLRPALDALREQITADVADEIRRELASR